MANFTYRCPGCGAQYELRQVSTLQKRYCSNCNREIRPQESKPAKKPSGLLGCGGILLLATLGMMYFASRQEQRAPVPAPAAAPSPPQPVAVAPIATSIPMPGEPVEPSGPSESSPGSVDSMKSDDGLELEADLPDNPRNPEIVEKIPGKVIAVINGDTVKFLNNYHQQFEVRLDGVDAPELDQQHGTKAKEALASFVLGKEITLGKTGVDRYGRILGFLSIGPVDVGLHMLEDGWAWHFKKYNSNAKYRFAEERAKAAHLGLWKSDNVIPPWEYRDKKRGKP